MAYFKKYRNRLDLSEWIIHFVHQRTGREDLSELAELAADEGVDMDKRYPDYYDADGNAKYILDEYVDNECKIDDNASGFEVLKKVLHDGYIHSGWAMRNDKPTIYGPVSAVCFTEMPLYALVEYAKVRGQVSKYVGDFGIAFKRNELFAAGARPAIYGLSSDPVEVYRDERGIYQGRMLSEKQLPLSEQYRYVLTHLTTNPADKNIDWMMEREWRWPLTYDKLGVPGIPFFLSIDYASFFSEIFIIVSTDEECKEITNYLKTLYDSQSTNSGLEYNIQTIASAKVGSLESISKLDMADSIKIESIPFSQIHLPEKYNVTQGEATKIIESYNDACRIADEAIKHYVTNNPNFDENKGYWGFVNVIVDGYSKVVEVLRADGKAKSYSDGKYYLGQMSSYKSMNIDLLEVGARAAANFLSDKLNEHFRVDVRFD